MKKFIVLLIFGVITPLYSEDSLYVGIWRPNYQPATFSSANDGVSWTQLPTHPSWPTGSYTGVGLALDKYEHLYLALWDPSIALQHYKSTDYGNSWTYTGNITDWDGGTDDPYVVLTCGSDGAMYAATWRNEGDLYPYAYKSTDAGMSWCNKSYIDAYQRHSAAGYEDPISITSDLSNNLFVLLWKEADAPRVYKSTNGANSWSFVTNPVSWTDADPSVSIVADESNNLYAALWSDPKVPQIYFSSDGGISWSFRSQLSSVGDGSDFNNYADITYSKSGAFYLGVWRDQHSTFYPYIYKSTDACMSWTFQGTVINWAASEHPALALVNISPGAVFTEEESPIPTSKLEAFPNPFYTSITIRGADNELEIYDHVGRLVIKTANCVWDGKNAQSKEVPPGIYFIRAKSYKPLKIVKLK